MFKDSEVQNIKKQLKEQKQLGMTGVCGNERERLEDKTDQLRKGRFGGLCMPPLGRH